MECGCVCDYGDGEVAEFFRQKKVKARKDYVCCECKGTIKRGETYHRVTGKWDGDFETFRTCLVCDAVRREYCCGGSWGYLWEEIGEALGYECCPPEQEGR